MARPRAYSHRLLATALLLLRWHSVNVSAQPYPAFSPSPSGDNLLVNGDFEDASATASTFITIDPRNSTGAYLTGWEVIYNPYNPSGNPSGGNIEVDGNYQWRELRLFFEMLKISGSTMNMYILDKLLMAPVSPLLTSLATFFLSAEPLLLGWKTESPSHGLRQVQSSDVNSRGAVHEDIGRPKRWRFGATGGQQGPVSRRSPACLYILKKSSPLLGLLLVGGSMY